MLTSRPALRAFRGFALAATALSIGVGVARGEDRELAAARCVHGAIVEPSDAGAQALYEGIRLGLERARWPRVCEDRPDDPSPASRVAAWRARVAIETEDGGATPWLFVVGDVLGATELESLGDLPHVVVLTGYSIDGEPIADLHPRKPHRGIVRGLIEARAVGDRVRAWAGRERPRVLWRGAGERDRVTRFLEAAGLDAIAEGSPGEAGAGLSFDAVLHLRLDPRPRAPFDRALAAARAGGVPLYTDDRGRFGEGAAVVLLPDHDIIGRVAADLARRLAAGEPNTPTRRNVLGVGVRTWIDLAACDGQGLRIPWTLLASSDRLRKGRPADARR